jgi:adenylate kinase family enzyme
LAKKELPKIKKLRPGRYILATSVGLTPGNVDELAALLSPFCQSKHDIIGQADLNAILRANEAIEQKHFKLWLTSEAVLSRVLHNDVFVQSMLTEEEIKQKLGLYVHTDSFDIARQKLESERVCILSGVPGVGKTTLAEMLLVEYLMNDWQVIAIHQNVAEGQKLFSRNKAVKQVFYYDDFLGQISTGEKLGKNEDRAILQLIEAVARTSNKRFILTTREYILAQARAEHEHLARANIDLYRFVVSCDDYSDLNKARILANHLYFAEVPQEHIAALVATRTYRSIISHRNYNPRIIEWMTHTTETEACSPKKYPAVFLDRLENPYDLWTHAFENQISEAARHLLLALGSCGDGLLLSDLQKAFEAFYLGRGKRYGFSVSPSSFQKSLDEMEGNFIRIERSLSNLVVSCHNPSVLDFLDRWLRKHPNDTADLLRYAVFFEQVERLFNVFHVGSPRKGGEENPQLDAAIVEQAIDGTLLAPSVRLAKTGERPSRWIRSGSGIWDRLRTCCRVGTNIDNGQLRQSIHEHIETHLAEVDRHPGELSNVMPLLDVID